MAATPPNQITIPVDPDHPFGYRGEAVGDPRVAPAQNVVNVRPYVALVLLVVGWATVTATAFLFDPLAGIAWCGLTALALGLGLAFEDT